MASLNALAQQRTDLTGEDVDRLHLLVADWQLLADLSFADLVLWLPVRDGGGFVAAAQMRPTTGPTVHHDDVVGTVLPAGRRPQVDQAYAEGRICRETDPDWPDGVPVREETIPVRRPGGAGPVVAVVSRHTNLAAARTPSRLELTYLRTADDLAVMLAEGRFPVEGDSSALAGAPRVGDGFVRLDEAGLVTYASPNAVSAYRRLGLASDLVGRHLGHLTAQLAAPAEPVEEALPTLVGGAAARQTEVVAAGATVRLRVLPLTPGGRRTGAVVLCRDVTEVRRRERELVSKDTTIREIHHRVKNNLQTVAALLRLQGRRLAVDDDPGARAAATALEEAQRRVASIALVHETLSRSAEETAPFDEVADQVAAGLGQPVGAAGPVHVVREGSFGLLPPEVATPLALVLVELLGNAAEHGLAERGGTVTVRVARTGPAAAETLEVTVSDDGVGLPETFDPARSSGLGLQIVRTLVEGELGGRITLGRGGVGADGTAADGTAADGTGGPGARVTVTVPVPAG